MIPIISSFRYPVAVKSPRDNTKGHIEEFLEEVKSMLEINSYHDNIVNLQGITYDNIKDGLVNVRTDQLLSALLENSYSN